MSRKRYCGYVDTYFSLCVSPVCNRHALCSYAELRRTVCRVVPRYQDHTASLRSCMVSWYRRSGTFKMEKLWRLPGPNHMPSRGSCHKSSYVALPLYLILLLGSRRGRPSYPPCCHTFRTCQLGTHPSLLQVGVVNLKSRQLHAALDGHAQSLTPSPFRDCDPNLGSCVAIILRHFSATSRLELSSFLLCFSLSCF